MRLLSVEGRARAQYNKANPNSTTSYITCNNNNSLSSCDHHISMHLPVRRHELQDQWICAMAKTLLVITYHYIWQSLSLVPACACNRSFSRDTTHNFGGYASHLIIYQSCVQVDLDKLDRSVAKNVSDLSKSKLNKPEKKVAKKVLSRYGSAC